VTVRRIRLQVLHPASAALADERHADGSPGNVPEDLLSSGIDQTFVSLMLVSCGGCKDPLLIGVWCSLESVLDMTSAGQLPCGGVTPSVLACQFSSA